MVVSLILLELLGVTAPDVWGSYSYVRVPPHYPSAVAFFWMPFITSVASGWQLFPLHCVSRWCTCTLVCCLAFQWLFANTSFLLILVRDRAALSLLHLATGHLYFPETAAFVRAGIGYSQVVFSNSQCSRKLMLVTF